MYILDVFRLVPRSRKVKIKRKKGVIISNPDGLKRYIFYISNILLIFGLILVVYVYIPVTKAVVEYRKYESRLNVTVPDQDKTVVVDDIVQEDKGDFLISVPKILAEAKVVTNVSPSDKKTFDKILYDGSVAMATGSDVPGSGPGSSMFMFSHSTLQDVFGARKNAVFYLLGELIEGDYVYVYYEGNKYVYEVYKSEVVAAGETGYFEYSEEDQETLILQTCWPLGTNWRRLLIIAKRVDESI